MIQSQWTGSVTINEEFLSSAPGENGELASNSFYTVGVSYASFKAALAAHDAGNPYATAAVAALPAMNPLTGNPTLELPLPYARMLGLSSATETPDDIVTLNTSYNWSYGQDVIDTITHEITEGGMGRIGGLGDQNSLWSAMDLFRYSSAGVRDLTDGRDGVTTYFSYDGTHLSSAAGLSFNNEYTPSGFSNGGDTADFTQLDVFGTGSPGETFGLSATDIEIMDTLGWTPTGSPPPPPPPPPPPTPTPPALTAAVESPSATTLAPGGSFSFTLYDLNLGAGASSASTTAIYLSTDSTITTSDTLLTTQSVGALAPYPSSGYFDQHGLSVNLPGGLTPGTYYIGAIADYNDPNIATDAPNPTYDVVKITVTSPPPPPPPPPPAPPPPPPPAPALTGAVESLSATTVAAGGSLGLTLYDLNLGAGASSASTTALYLSTDATITTGDTLLATQSVGALTPYPAAGYYDSHGLTVTLPGGLTAGTYYIGAIADYNDPNIATDAPSPTYDVLQITVTSPSPPPPAPPPPPPPSPPPPAPPRRPARRPR